MFSVSPLDVFGHYPYHQLRPLKNKNGCKAELLFHVSENLGSNIRSKEDEHTDYNVTHTGSGVTIAISMTLSSYCR